MTEAASAAQAARTIEDVLARSAFPEDTVVYRGLTGGNAAFLAVVGIEPGDEIGHEVLTSTSRSRAFIEDCLRLYEEPRYLIVMHLPTGSRALDIAAISIAPDEQEVLLQREHRSTVTRVSRSDEFIEVEVAVHADA